MEIIENTKEEKFLFSKRGWGHEDLTISEDELKALLEGKTLAFDDGEYTHTLTLERFVKGGENK